MLEQPNQVLVIDDDEAAREILVELLGRIGFHAFAAGDGKAGLEWLAGAAAPLGLAVGLLVRLRETLWIVVGLVTLYVEGVSWRPLRRAAREPTPAQPSGKARDRARRGSRGG